MKRGNWLAIAGVLVVVALFVLYQQGKIVFRIPFSSRPLLAGSVNKTKLHEGQKLPFFDLKSLQQGGDTLGQFISKHKETLIVVSAPQCPACKEDMRELEQASDVLAQFGRAWVVSNTDATSADLSEKIQFDMFLDPGWVATREWEIKSYPTYVLVDQDGTVTYVQSGRVVIGDTNQLLVRLTRAR
jgi:thiol-disulfide isomerase/thioredoxin